MTRKLSKPAKRLKHYHGTFIGPVKVIFPDHAWQKCEALCHLCSWAYFHSTGDGARDILLFHLDSEHWNKKEWQPLKPEQMPGQGWGVLGNDIP